MSRGPLLFLGFAGLAAWLSSAKSNEDDEFKMQELVNPISETLDLVTAPEKEFFTTLSDIKLTTIDGHYLLKALAKVPERVYALPGLRVLITDRAAFQFIGRLFANHMLFLRAREQGDLRVDEKALERFQQFINNTDWIFCSPAWVQNMYKQNALEIMLNRYKRDKKYLDDDGKEGEQLVKKINEFAAQTDKFQSMILDGFKQNIAYWGGQFISAGGAPVQIPSVDYRQFASLINMDGAGRNVTLQQYLKTEIAQLEYLYMPSEYCAKTQGSNIPPTGPFPPCSPGELQAELAGKFDNPGVINDFLMWRVFCATSKTFLLEYALAKFMQLTYIQGIDPTAGAEGASQLMKGIGATAATVMGIAAYAGPQAIVSIVATALTAVGAFISSGLAISTANERAQTARAMTGKMGMDILKYFNVSLHDFSAYKLGLIVPTQTKDAWEYYVWANRAQVAPRYLGFDFDLPTGYRADIGRTLMNVIRFKQAPPSRVVTDSVVTITLTPGVLPPIIW